MPMRKVGFIALWSVGILVAILLLLGSFVAVECGVTPVTGVGFASGGQPVVVRNDGQVERWGDIFDRADYFYTNGHTDFIDGIAYSPDGKSLERRREDHTVRIWDAQDGHQLATLRADSPQNSVVFAPNGKYLMSGGQDGTWILWDYKSGQQIKSDILPDAGAIGTAAISPDGSTLVVGTANANMDVINVDTGQIIATHQFPVRYQKDTFGTSFYPYNMLALSFAPDGKTILAANFNADNAVYLFDTKNWTVLDRFPSAFPDCATYAPDAQSILVCDSYRITAWDIHPHNMVLSVPIT